MSREKSDLTAEEQANVRTAIRFLRARCGGWEPLARVLRSTEETVRHVAHAQTVSASMAVRVARFVKVGIDDLLAGKYPPEGACPYCGHVKDSVETSTLGPWP